MQVPAGRPIEVHIMGADFLEVLAAVDISLGGVGIHVGHDFESAVDHQVNLVITVPGEKPFMAQGVVRNVRSEHRGRLYGVEFTAISERGKEAILSFVAFIQNASERSALPSEPP